MSCELVVKEEPAEMGGEAIANVTTPQKSAKKITLEDMARKAADYDKKHPHAVQVNQIQYYKCNICGKNLGWPSGLKRHIKGVHEKIKDAICEVCGFMAARNDGLRQHREFCPTNDGSKKRKRQDNIEGEFK